MLFFFIKKNPYITHPYYVPFARGGGGPVRTLLAVVATIKHPKKILICILYDTMPVLLVTFLKIHEPLLADSRANRHYKVYIHTATHSYLHHVLYTIRWTLCTKLIPLIKVPLLLTSQLNVFSRCHERFSLRGPTANASCDVLKTNCDNDYRMFDELPYCQQNPACTDKKIGCPYNCTFVK